MSQSGSNNFVNNFAHLTPKLLELHSVRMRENTDQNISEYGQSSRSERQKASGFLTFSGGTEMEHSLKMGYKMSFKTENWLVYP